MKALGLPAHLNKDDSVDKPRYIDATLGLGGHSVEIIKRGGKVLGIDVDENAIKIAESKLKEVLRAKSLTGLEACPTPYQDSKEFFTLVIGNFIHIDEIARSYGFTNVDGILFDLGISTPQLSSSTRGFSFQNKAATLDMRFNPKVQGVTGFDLLNSLNKRQLQELFEITLPKYISRKLAGEIIDRRRQTPFKTVGDFIGVIVKTVHGKEKINIATLPFLALRIAVNSELVNLKESLPRAFSLLKPKGRLVVISFHSKEDVIVKKFYLEKESDGQAKILTQKPIIPKDTEIHRNPKSRSAKMRVLEKI
ncbi:16S rRNA (cytosine(1402)-N(4))-methyltransferase [Candidatus Woesebacteria bacterium RIFCSPLOWO2_01_FULL_39_61]|uniref:Ribosomal RNA small subunit methyltransferase H n=1 Tax=Candidatus Woesebacteria bacterium RIFCSPHIGHO2_02_FULL_39_13 TaxID=1802505 RepID=A0A1F7YZ60_9BACT|nr:MAG: 16S rRNA (cytosine(1402)-N(4))-methyltransferase [Candidatus Woesebacteria bacterium RIFCSPHIGHO2_01_FULL_39_95]OGM32653.1 MAG: 16S rRNA (cytosine(1402)-N(4))-methyltransferase [Candidatus Woesebacteria bacterium RIFCSPHIGHO2_02_FULL_39_13]OGM36438.1 MAG: 16S rRNA (cytosine(1402)-N(4))-methyltransferase [Candidatus Woesebacteria bacterium RIFCSPHIGHO2_12_FULL_40_20]OGM66723.1 MAG: 16S rRNA (cytosine(1402)-N(4))-methyltransferase [Candidatus Woesebacteria bacterium RIFCSPLOWO2_01_FULL_39_